MLDLAGGDPRGNLVPDAPPLAGRSLAKAFPRDVRVERDYLYFHHNQNRALRVGDFKLVAIGQNGPWALYDLAKDRSEQHDLASSQPERVSQMAARWKQIDQGFVTTREAATPASLPRMVAAPK